MPLGVTQEQRNLDTAATEFQRRYHISVDDGADGVTDRLSTISVTPVRSVYFGLKKFALALKIRYFLNQYSLLFNKLSNKYFDNFLWNLA